MEIKLQETESKGKVFIGQLEKIDAEMTFSKAGEKLIIIDHTEVNPEFSGKGYGRQLLNYMVELARQSDKKILPLCPYAASVFKKDETIRDVLK